MLVYSTGVHKDFIGKEILISLLQGRLYIDI